MWSSATGGLRGAEGLLMGARAELLAAAPAQWRSTAARAFADRLAGHVAGCEMAIRMLARASAALAEHEAELALARAALGPSLVHGFGPNGAAGREAWLAGAAGSPP